MNYIYATVIVLTLFLYCLYESGISRKTEENPCIELTTCKSKENNHFYGIVSNQLKSNISFRSEGRIIYFPYSLGDRIKKGQIVAKLEGELYKIQLKEETDQLQEAKVKYDHLQKYYKRMDFLHNSGAISDNDWENAYFDLMTQEKEVEYRKERTRYINKQIEYNSLKSPIDCVVAEKLKEVGEYVKIGEPIMVAISNTKTRIEILIGSNEINDIHLNDRIKVFKNLKNYYGKIVYISPSSANNGGYLVKIDLENYYPELKAGMSVEVFLLNKTDSCFLDNQSIKNNSILVFDENEKKFKKTEITILSKNENKTEIKNCNKIENKKIMKIFKENLDYKICE